MICQYHLCDFLFCTKNGGEILAFYDIFESLCTENGVTPTQVARDNGIKQSVVAMWKKRDSTPKAETVQKLADYFGVSVDYLLGLRPLPDDLADVFLNRNIGQNIKIGRAHV